MIENDLNQLILNEVYFGKNIRTKLLEKTCDCFIMLLRNDQDQMIMQQLFEINKKIGNEILQLEKEKQKYLQSNNIDSSTGKLRMQQILNLFLANNKIVKVQKNTPLGYSIYILESLFKIIFGFDEVVIKIIDIDDKTEKARSAYVNPIQGQTGSSLDKNKKMYTVDNFGRKLSSDEVINAMNVKNNGISIDWRRCALSTIITIPKIYGNIGMNITGGELLSVLLHEIGHNFFYLILPYNNFNSTKRANEKFADKFAALYGYGQENISFSSKQKSFYNYMNYKKFKLYQYQNPNVSIQDLLYKQSSSQYQKLSYRDGEKQYGLSDKRIDFETSKLEEALENPKLTNKEKEQIQQQLDALYTLQTNIKIPSTSIDSHPIDVSRFESQLHQLNVELKNPNITNSQRKRILKDIEQIKELIRKAKSGKIHIQNFEYLPDQYYKEFQYYDQEEKRFNNSDQNRKYLDRENDEEYMSKMDSRIIMGVFDNMHAKTKRESLMITNFKQFFQNIFNPKSNSNDCTLSFEKYLVTKYEKQIGDSIIEYAQKLCKIKINELLELSMRKYEIISKKFKGTKSDLITMMNDTIFQYNKENDNLSNLDQDDIDFINKIFNNKIFMSNLLFNSQGQFESIDYDQNELKRYKELYKKYYL